MYGREWKGGRVEKPGPIRGENKNVCDQLAGNIQGMANGRMKNSSLVTRYLKNEEPVE